MTKMPTKGGRHFRDPKTGALLRSEPKPAPADGPKPQAPAEAAKTSKKGQ